MYGSRGPNSRSVSEEVSAAAQQLAGQADRRSSVELKEHLGHRLGVVINTGPRFDPHAHFKREGTELWRDRSF